MRLISFALTTEQVEARSKTVTRRVGWRFVKPGDVLQPVRKVQGLKKGESPTRVGGPIRVLDVRREPLDTITPADVVLEGFPGKSPAWFVALVCRANKCHPHDEVARIEFEYLESTT